MGSSPVAITLNPICICGFVIEILNHFFRLCPRFTNERQNFLYKIGSIIPNIFTKTNASIQATKFGGNDRAVTLSFPWGFIKVNDLSLPPVTLKIFFVRFSFSPFCVKTITPSSSFVSSWFVSFFAEACFSSCKNIAKLYSLVRRPHSFGLFS